MSEIDEEEEKEICSYDELAFNKSLHTTRVNGWNEKDMIQLPTNGMAEELNRVVVMMDIISFITQFTRNSPLASTTSRRWDERHQKQLCLTYDGPVAIILVNSMWPLWKGNEPQELDVSLSHLRSILPAKIPRDGCITAANANNIYFQGKSQEMDVSLPPMRTIYTSIKNPKRWMYHCRQCDQYFHPNSQEMDVSLSPMRFILPSKIPRGGCIIAANAIYASIQDTLERQVYKHQVGDECLNSALSPINFSP
ncbi:hypothetical protein AAHA92_19609 [Salvia divinorum]|uniref:Uncharacterized protein n=1 Tax=Salvia divinorum TaxID=28513 RepID=A0ABD1H978_SALDI